MRNSKVNFALIHPQLCANDGDNFWRVLLGGDSGKIDEIVVAGCDPGYAEEDVWLGIQGAEL